MPRKQEPHPDRDNYLLALNGLIGTLSTTDFSRMDEAAFCTKYQVDKNLIRVLVRMGFIVEKKDGRHPLYQITKSLYSVTPDQMIAWVNREQKPAEVITVGQVKKQVTWLNSDEEKRQQQEVAAIAGLKQATTELNELPPLTNTVNQIIEGLIEQAKEQAAQTTCATDCGMNYCDEHGCIDQKQTADALPLASLPVEPAPAEQGVWKGQAVYQEETTVTQSPPDHQPGEYVVSDINGNNFFLDTYDKALEVAKKVSRDTGVKTKIFKCIAEVECVHSFKITPIA